MQLPIYSPEDEQLLMAKLWAPKVKDDPEAFVMFAFPWGQKGTPLEHFHGPRKWQRKILRDIAEHIAANKQATAYEVLRMATSSGRGIGKSALVSWLILWMLSTRIGSTTIDSANSEAQLRSVTWAEITKWAALLMNSHCCFEGDIRRRQEKMSTARSEIINSNHIVQIYRSLAHFPRAVG